MSDYKNASFGYVFLSMNVGWTMTLEKSDIKVNVTTLDPSFLQSLKSCDVSVCENLTKGSYLYHQGDTADAFFFAESGLIGLYHVVDNGKESLIRLYESGQFFGYRTWFSSQKTYHCSAKMLIPAKVWRITPYGSNFLADNTDLMEHFMAAISDELANAESRLAHMSYDKSLTRVSDALNFLKTRYPLYPWSYREIAEFAGCETETAIRIARKLIKEGKLPEPTK